MSIRAAVCGSLLAAVQSRPAGGTFTGQQLGRMLLWTAVIVMVFLVGTFAIHRFSRRYRAYLVRTPQRPTASDDVWKQHRLPESWDESESP